MTETAPAEPDAAAVVAQVFVIDAGDCRMDDHSVLEVFVGTGVQADARAAALHRPGTDAYASPLPVRGPGPGEWHSTNRPAYSFPSWGITRAVDGRVDVYLGTKWFTARDAAERAAVQEFAASLLAALADPGEEVSAAGVRPTAGRGEGLRPRS